MLFSFFLYCSRYSFGVFFSCHSFNDFIEICEGWIFILYHNLSWIWAESGLYVQQSEAPAYCLVYGQFQICSTVCHLRKGIFVAGALDNIDHNPSSTTAQSSFHGTGISIIQFPTKDNIGICREPLALGREVTMKEALLTQSYTTVPAVALMLPQLQYQRETAKVSMTHCAGPN